MSNSKSRSEARLEQPKHMAVLFRKLDGVQISAGKATSSAKAQRKVAPAEVPMDDAEAQALDVHSQLGQQAAEDQAE